MGLFDFFKKKSSDSNPVDREQPEPIDNNSYLLETLRNRLIKLGYQINKHPQYLALINSEIEIATVIIDNPNNHPSILHLMILTIQSKYFPNGIEENIVGIGTNIQDKVNSVKVTDRQTFIKFIDLLRKDFVANPESWENKTLPNFLEALSAYAEDIQGYYDNMKLNISADKPDWSTFADIFKGATIYE